jgi:transposase-like protein
MSKKVRKYPAEYKAEAVKLALSSESVSGVAKSLGMPEATLYVWVLKLNRLEPLAWLAMMVSLTQSM